MVKSYLFFLHIILCFFLSASQLFAQKQTELSEEKRLVFDRVFFKAMKEKMQGNYSDALLTFKEAAIINPENSNVYYQIAQLQLAQKSYGEALRYASVAVKLNDDNRWYKSLLAEAYKATKQYNKSASVNILIYEKHDKNISNLYEAASNYFFAGNFKKSTKTLNRIEKISGNREDVIIKREQIYLSQNKIGKAIQEVLKLIVLFPDDIHYKGMLADLYVANGKEKEGLKIYENILIQKPGNGYASFALSDYYAQKGDKEKSYAFLKQGMASSDVPVKSKIDLLVSLMLDQKGAVSKVQLDELSDVFISANPDETAAYMLKGDLYLHGNDLKSARKKYQTAVGLDGNNMNAWLQILFCNQELRDSERMKTDCELALTYFPAEPRFYNGLCYANMQLKNYEAAIKNAQSALEYISENEDKTNLLTLLGDASHYAKKYSLADSSYEEALKIKPDNSLALNNYAYFLSVRKTKLDLADSMSKKSLDLEPDNPSYLDTYGWILFQKGNYLEAKIPIEKSLKASPNNAEVLEHLGDVMYKLNDKVAAVENWKKAKSLGGGSVLIDRKIQEEKLIEQ